MSNGNSAAFLFGLIMLRILFKVADVAIITEDATETEVIWDTTAVIVREMIDMTTEETNME